MNAHTITSTVALLAAAATASTTLADITVTQGSSAPTYSTTLNFDEAGGPVGNGLSNSAFAAFGISSLMSGDGNNRVGDFNAETGAWGLGGGTNSFTGNFGIFINFDSDLTDFSAQIWDPSGAPTPFGGGLFIFIFDDGVQVGFAEATPAWGGIGDDWFNISATGGMVFDEVRILGFGFVPTTYGDNFSWNAVPTPGSFAVLALGGLVASRRRRH